VPLTLVQAEKYRREDRK